MERLNSFTPVIKPMKIARFHSVSPKTKVHLLTYQKNGKEALNFGDTHWYVVPWSYRNDTRPVVLAAVSQYIAAEWKNELQNQIERFPGETNVKERFQPEDIHVHTVKMDQAANLAACVRLPLLIVVMLACDVQTRQDQLEYHHCSLIRDSHRK
jgi:hypothetical protein